MKYLHRLVAIGLGFELLGGLTNIFTYLQFYRRVAIPLSVVMILLITTIVSLIVFLVKRKSATARSEASGHNHITQKIFLRSTIYIIVMLLVYIVIGSLKRSRYIHTFDVCTLYGQEILFGEFDISRDLSSIDGPGSMVFFNDKTYRVGDISIMKQWFTDNPSFDKWYGTGGHYRRIWGTGIVYHKMAGCYGGACMMYDPHRKDVCTEYFTLTEISSSPSLGDK